MAVLLMLVAVLAAGACRGPGEVARSRDAIPSAGTVPTPPPFDAQVRLDPRLVADLKLVPEAFRTASLTEGKDVDSLAFWQGPEGPPWLLVTLKDDGYVLVLDAETGAELDRIGGAGEALGRLGRPNGIAVVDDVVVVAERDNRRVQVLRLPAFEPLGAFGQELLKWPYGVAVDRLGEWYELYVTDSYDSPEHEPPTPDVCRNRVRHYRFRPAEDGLEVELVRSFGDPSGPGALYRVESVAIDRGLGRLYLADESRLRLNLKAYSLGGEFLGSTFGDGVHYREPEGIALLRCGTQPEEGYILAADQTQPSRFLVYERRSLDYLGGFTGEPTIDVTDGITFAAQADAGRGMLYGTEHDVRVVAYRWSDVADELGLRSDCR
jgi:3-phytase